MSKSNPQKYITSLRMNGLNGRMLEMPAKKPGQRRILLLYGHHASLERIAGLAEELNKYGSVTVPDFPGFGGMQSLYKIGMEPSLDNLADYLAAFVKMHYKRDRLTILGMSFGFVVATRMLQKYPELAEKVDFVVSVVGFAHKDDFKFKKRTFWMFKVGAKLFSGRFFGWAGHTMFMRPALIKAIYKIFGRQNVKLTGFSKVKRKKLIDFEVTLWRSNELRTYARTTLSMLTLDLCQAKVGLPVYHVSVEPDRYFNNQLVEQHMRVIFTDFHGLTTSLAGHAPTVVASAKEAAPFIPDKLRQLLSSK
jgi:pimeloyl-ACP methyl ester carboxylesterase